MINGFDLVKRRADDLAEKHAFVSRQLLLRSPLTAGLALTVKTNYKFFRRLAGLGGRDLVRSE